MANRKKTERKYTKIENMQHFVEKLAKFGDRTAYRYFDRHRNLLSITYRNLSAKILRQAAGYVQRIIRNAVYYVKPSAPSFDIPDGAPHRPHFVTDEFGA